MKMHKLFRRRLLGGFLAALTAWLGPRPPQVAAAPRRPAPPIPLPTSRSVLTCTYAYDGVGRLISITEHPARLLNPLPRPLSTGEHGTTYTYDGRPNL